MKKILLAILLLCSIAHADMYPLANYTVSLDLDSSQYALLPFDLQVNDDSALAQTVISKDINYDFGMLGWTQYFEPENADTILGRAMNTFESICARITTIEENRSIVLTGLAKQGGRRCYIKAVPIDLEDNKYSKIIYLVAAFKDPAQNEKLIKEFDAQDLSYA